MNLRKNEFILQFLFKRTELFNNQPSRVKRKEVRRMQVVLPESGLFSPTLRLGGKPVNVFAGEIRIDVDETQNISRFCSEVWSRILEKVDNSPRFTGIIRFDLVPHFPEAPQSSSSGGGVIDLGPLSIRGIYEVNVHSPECGAALAALQVAGISMVPVSARIAEAIRARFGNKVVFVPGSGTLKQEWGSAFIQSLRDAGLTMEVAHDPRSCNDDESPIWRWGDARFGPDDEFPKTTQAWLLGSQVGGRQVFNTVPISPAKDLGRKDLIPAEFSGGPLPLSAANKENSVMKPLRGSSGNGVLLGPQTSPEEWQAGLREVVNGNAGLFEAMWLPRVNFGSEAIAMDFNATFWADGPWLQYLYSIVRIDYWDRYWERGVINVAKGAGIASVLDDE